MKRKLLSLMFITVTLLLSGVLNAQTVSITANASTTQLNGLGHLNYHVSEYIYTEAEIGATNFITAGTSIDKINLNATVVGTPNFFSNVKIYLMNVASTTTAFTAGTYSTAGYTEVFSGTFTASAVGWVGVTLTTPFVRTAGSNLQMMIERTDNVDHSSSAALFTWATAGGNNLSASATTSRRYNGTAALTGTTALATSTFRVATQFIHTASNDAALTAFTSVPSPSCFTTGQTISVTLNNAGTNAIAASAAPVTLSVTGANTYTATVSNPLIINAGGSITVTFNGVTLNNTGTNNVSVYSTLAGDASTANDTLKTTITTTTVSSSFPAVTGAESSPLVFEYLKTLAGNRQLWGLNSSFTTSTTGAYKNADLADSIRPKTGTRFYLFDSWSGASSVGFRNVLFTGCFAFPPTNGTNVYDLKFWMSQDNSLATDLDSVYAVVSTDKGVTWTRIEPGFARVNAAFTTPGWIQQTVNLTAYAGQTIQVGIEGVSKYGNVIGIDDIVVRANSTLPISLTSFSGTKTGDKNSLKWTTSSEINNQGFDLERSVDGITFSSIATIESKATNGNSSSALNYEYLDARPVAATNYYRLKQTDKDGKTTYSQIVVLKSAKVGTITIAAIYPNPAKDKLNITIASGNAEKATLAIYDATGRLVLQKALTLVAGEVSLSENIDRLKAGSYLVKVIDEKGYAMDIKTLIKQ